MHERVLGSNGMQHLYWSGGKDSWFVLAICALELTLQKGWGKVGENQQTGRGRGREEEAETK